MASVQEKRRRELARAMRGGRMSVPGVGVARSGGVAAGMIGRLNRGIGFTFPGVTLTGPLDALGNRTPGSAPSFVPRMPPRQR